MPCAPNLAAIAKICSGGNAPGFKTTIQIVETSDVDVVAAAAGHIISTDFTMVVGKVFFPWIVSKGDQQYQTVPEGENENITYKSTLQFFIPKIAAATSNILNDVTGAEFLVILTDKSGNKVLLGEKEDGATIKVQKQTTDKNGYIVTVEWESSNLPYFYTGAIPN